MKPVRRAWLARFTWAVVTAQNKVLCEAKGAFHGPTSDGFNRTTALWDRRHVEVMTLDEAVDLCRQCHRLAPFCFYNGNTFAAIARAVVNSLNLGEAKAFVVRSLAGHIVAGVASDSEKSAFKEFSDEFETPDRD